MPVRPQVSYPGVYVQEVPSGVRTIVGVSTSIAVFIGRTKQGPLDKPVLCLNYSDFEREFSSEYAGSDMARAVRLFFQNGGTQCYAMRIADGAKKSEVTLKSESKTDVLKVTAKSPGLVGDKIRLAVTYNGQHPESTFNMEIFRWGKNSTGGFVKTDLEKWSNLSMDPNSPRYAETYVNQNSKLVELEDKEVEAAKGYSQSGRAVPGSTDIIFRNQWIALMGTTGSIATGSPWTCTSQITSLSTYTGLTAKTYTFTVGGAGALTVGTDAIPINWNDGSGNSGSVTVPAIYTIGDPISMIEDIVLSLSAGNLVNGEQFTLEALPTRHFRISVDNGSFVDIDLSGLDFNSLPLNTAAGARNNLAGEIQSIIKKAVLLAGSTVTVSVDETGPNDSTGGNTYMLRIASANGDVRIEPATTFDLAARLMLGTAQGGIEVSRYAQTRPAPTGVVFDISDLVAFAQRVQTAFRTFTINTTAIDMANTLETTGVATDRMYQDGYSSTVTGNSDGVREKWSIIANAINAKKASDPTFKWSAKVWGSRLALIPGEGDDNSQGKIKTSGGDGVNLGNDGAAALKYFIPNVRYYSLGTSGKSNFQQPGVSGNDGKEPKLNNYRDAFKKLDKEVDLFNLMILPTDKESDIKILWGPASVFCQKRRAFLLMDPPTSWETVQQATHPSTGVNSLRIGLVKDHSAIFYPRITIRENGLKKDVGPSGAIAGLMARIDGSRGVWKAAAGTEADLRGIVGLEYKFSDDENGVLNKRAVNTLRIFPNGIVSWGARTMDGDDDFGSEYKYIPVRRLALYMEESLYRGLKWVVFEPNDEPLWAQIRLNVGSFMHNLFRQGAFQGVKPKDAYFVKCDSETTTQNDINLGMVNIWVGFAPLKPAEFVILYLQQMAGQIEV